MGAAEKLVQPDFFDDWHDLKKISDKKKANKQIRFAFHLLSDLQKKLENEKPPHCEGAKGG